MVKLRFIGKNLAEYKGIDGLGGFLHLKKGDICDVDSKVADALVKSYSRDFELYTEEKAEHAPRFDKELKKSKKFKAK